MSQKPKVHLISIDREDAESNSIRLEMKGTNLDKLEFTDIKLVYFKQNLNEINKPKQRKLLTDEEYEGIYEDFHNCNPFIEFEEFTEIRDFYGTREDGKPKYNTNLVDFKFNPGERYLVLGNSAYRYVKDMIHLGPRGEGFYDLSEMEYLRTFNNVCFKFGYINFERQTQWLDKAQYDQMLPHLEAIQKKLRNADLREIVSKKNGRTYYIFNFDKVADQEDFNDFINLPDDEFFKEYPKLDYSKVIRSNEDIDNAFNYFIENHKNATKENPYWLGLDYETNGFPFDDPEFYWMGVGIADLNGLAAYFDMEWMQSIGNNFEYFKTKYKEFLDECAEDCHTYNVGFEMRCTYLLLGVLYFFQESSTINKANGLVMKNYSLKYTAMLNLLVPSWDDDFDKLTGIFEEMMWDGYDGDKFIGTYDPNEETDKVPLVFTKKTYKISDWWKYISETYPNDIPEFERLINSYWGYPFKCIPSTILGKYCNLDSFHTVWLRKVCEDTYPDKRVWTCFNANLVYGALLNIHGIHIDMDYNNKLELLSACYAVWGKLNCLLTTLTIELNAFGLDESNKTEALDLLIQGYPIFDSKQLLMAFEDESWEYGFNEDKFNAVFGIELRDLFIEQFKNYGIKYNSWLRTQKIFNELNGILEWKFKPIYNENHEIIGTVECDKDFLFNKKLTDIMKYSYMRNCLKEVENLLSQIDITKPDWYVTTLEGEKKDLDWVSDWVKGVMNINSPQVAAQLKFKIWQYYLKPFNKINMIWDGWAVEDFNKPVEDEYTPFNNWNEFDSGSLTWIYILTYRYLKLYHKVCEGHEAYDRFLIDGDPFTCFYNIAWDKFSYVTGQDEWGNDQWELCSGAQKLMSKLEEFIHPQTGELTEHMVSAATNLLKSTDPQEFRDTFNEIDPRRQDLMGAAKFGFCYEVQKKYDKVLTTYIRGQFWKYNKAVNQDDENLIATERYYTEDQLNESEGKIHWKCYSPFQVCQKQSKRWSAATHTIPSKSEVKRVMTSPPGFLFSYNDISGAEVRCISHLANDPFMLKAYAEGKDPYIMMAKVLAPEHEGDEAWYKRMRPSYKQTLLASMYGMGLPLLASRLEKSEEEAQELSDRMFSLIPKIQEIIIQKGEYCVEHNGLCDSILGDKLYMEDAPDRWARLGINQVIQSFAAVGLADSFENMIYKSYKEKEVKVRPVNVVHDSTQNLVETTKLFELNSFFYKHITGYLTEKYGIPYDFELEIGTNYFDQCAIIDVEPGKIVKLEGNYRSLIQVLEKCYTDGLKYNITSIKKKDEELYKGDNKLPEEFKPKVSKNLWDQFFGRWMAIASYEMDLSKYEIILEKTDGFMVTKENQLYTL